MPKKRNRRKQTRTLQDRLESFALEACAAAARMPKGAEQAEMLQKARDSEAAAKLEIWQTSRKRKSANP